MPENRPHRRAEIPPTPERTIAQRRSALQSANRVRTTRAQLKLDLKAGRRQAGPLLTSVPPLLETMKVRDLLLAVPKVGPVKANKILNSARTSPSKTLGGMTSRQRAEVHSMLPG